MSSAASGRSPLVRWSEWLDDQAATLQRQLTQWLRERDQSVEDAIRAEGQRQASEQASMANLINSLRLIDSFDWSEFFESVSLVEQILQRDPAGVYARMDFRSRDRYRHAIEELADPTGEAQQHMALASVEYARRVAERTPAARGAHVGYHLIGRGRLAFEASLAWVPKPGQRLRRLFFRWAAPAYVGAIAAGTALLLLAAMTYAYGRGGRGVWLLAIMLLGAIPASEFTIQILQRLLSHLVQPRRLPRLEYDLIPREARTMVIVPTILDSVEGVRDLAEHLEVQAAGNLDPHIHFALLSDFRDAIAVTLNSSIGVQCVLNGIPTITMDEGAMAWDVTGHTIADVCAPDREAWCHFLAWTQWTDEEIREGRPWQHLLD